MANHELPQERKSTVKAANRTSRCYGAAAIAGCGTTTDAESDASQPSTSVGGTVAPVDEATSGIEITVVLPSGWPNPIYPGQPNVVIEDEDDQEHVFTATDRRVSVQLPAAGDYSVGAMIEDGGCYDTAGIADAGNPPVSVADGDVFELRATGEICD